jgi:uncharacterized protein YciI
MLFHVTGHIPDPSLLGPHVAAEQVVSQQLQDEGSTLFAVRRTDRPGVFLLIEADDLAHAQANMARLPFVAAGLMTLDYVEVSRV